jgi:hypothetical protein
VSDDVTDTWDAALDRFEASLVQGETGIGLLLTQLGDASATVLVEPWSPPGDIGPIPPELVVRARELYARSAVLEGQLQFVRDQTTDRLADLSSRRPSSWGTVDEPGPGASAIDHLA